LDEPLKEAILYGDPFRYGISMFLSPRELYGMRSVNRMYRHLIDDQLIREVVIQEINHRLLRIFGGHQKLDNFYQVLEQTCAGISGSFILQCLLGECWEGSDIDIFLPHRHDWNQETLIDAFFHQIMHNQLEPITTYEFCESRVRQHLFPDGTHFQVIVVDVPSDDLQQFVCDDSDFDVCMNIYTVTNHMGKLFCYALKAIMNKWITCQHKPTDSRWLKYQRREFAFKGSPELLPSKYKRNGMVHTGEFEVKPHSVNHFTID
jgi:hypothetical protein